MPMPGLRRSITHRACLLLIVGLVTLLLPKTADAAKTLASEALSAAVTSGSIDQVRQELMMDMVSKQKYDFDEEGIETLGRGLVAQGDHKQGLEILQLNQMLFSESPAAANALADGYRASGDDISARIYYDMALRMDPDNAHAKQAVAEQGGAGTLAGAAMGGHEFDAEAMQAAMAEAGVEMSPDQQAKMKEAMAQLEAYQQSPEAFEAAEAQRAEEQRARQQQATAPTPSSKETAAAHESEFCEVLHRFNSQKRIQEEVVRARVEGEYGGSGAPNRTWNVETACGDFLIAVPLWADVSPPVMEVTGERSFSDAMGGTWVFQMESGQASSVVYTDSAGTVQEMKRLGDPRSFD
jgi:hypothetical protein